MLSDSADKFFHVLKSGGNLSSARLARWREMADRIEHRVGELGSLTDEEFRRAARELRWQAKSGIPLSKLLTEGYALVKEAAIRTVGLSYYKVQLMGGIALFEGGIAEMQTGEGKTLTAVLPAALHALMGKGTHVITTNDYLAQRDAEKMQPIYNQMELSVGCIQTPMQPPERRQAYSQDITYGTAKEFGFDFLRDRLRKGATPEDPYQALIHHEQEAADSGVVQRGLHFALIDEADSILIDDARTPLIIALPTVADPAMVNLYRWSDSAAKALTHQEHFLYEPDRRIAYLTEAGCRRVLLMRKPSVLDTLDTERIYKQVEQSLVANLGFMRDRDYVINDKQEVTIVDESTGRMMDGRRWQDGLHQAVESKERVPLTATTGQAARITVQSFFRLYTHLGGMTGTAVPVRGEVRRIYGLPVTAIPTHRPCIRTGDTPRIFLRHADKLQAIALDIRKYRDEGRSILVGTPSVEKSELLSEVLDRMGIPHVVLNARFHEQEAEIVSHSGEEGHVTIATNMAGRGTDILLDDIVRNNGGLHVIATEMHSSARIDRQLIGRAARQGDPGSYQFFLSLEDELLRSLKRSTVERKQRQAVPNEQGELTSDWWAFFRRTQRKLERQHSKQRKDMLKREQFRNNYLRRMGLDPYLELTD
ncbi:MAG: translocase [Planctomycetales bacterium]